jgi:hypothetical protein
MRWALHDNVKAYAPLTREAERSVGGKAAKAQDPPAQARFEKDV